LFNSSGRFSQYPALRQAVAGVTQTHDLVRSSMGRFAQPAEGLLPPGILGHDPGRRRNRVPLAKAKELIESTGLPLPIRLSASVHPTLTDRYSSLIHALFRAWSEIGIEISVVTTDMSSYNESWEKNEGIDLLIGRWFADYDDPDTFTYALFDSKVGEMRSYYSSAEFDLLIEKARLEREPEVREKIYRQIENHLMETGIFSPLFHDIDYRLAGPKVRHLALSSAPPYVNYSEIAKTEKVLPPVIMRQDRGVLRVPFSGKLTDLDPSLTIATQQADVLPSIFETLTYAGEGSRVIPWLASRFTAEDGGKRFRFHLRDGVRFHDGRRLTARDVRYSFERLLLNQESASRWLLAPIRGAKKLIVEGGKELEGFRIVSALEFVIELEQPISFFPALLAYTPSAILPEGIEKVEGSWKDGCVGTGPFRVVSFEPGRSLKLEANPGYWRSGLPKSEGLEFVFGSSPAETLAGFRNGQLSLAWALMASDVESLRREREFAAKLIEQTSLSTFFLVMNTRKQPFSDEATRRQFLDGIDIEEVVGKHLGHYAVARSLTPPSLLGFEVRGKAARSAKKPSSTARRSIKAEAHTAYSAQYSSLTTDLLAHARENGFDIEYSTLDVVGVQPNPKSESSPDVIFLTWIADYPDPDTFLYGLLHSESGLVGGYIGNSEIDALVERSRTETDTAVRQSIHRQVEEILRDRALIHPLFHGQAYCFARPEVEGLELNFFSPIVPYEKLSIRS
ncbi:MAG TPA: ABC transporter substrate-binding protein, partial [Acidobacteriota bacterium]